MVYVLSAFAGTVGAKSLSLLIVIWAFSERWRNDSSALLTICGSSSNMYPSIHDLLALYLSSGLPSLAG